MTRPAVLKVRSPAAWATLNAPVRCEVSEAFRCIGPCGIADVALLLDRPADSLYRHVKALVKAGFVVTTGSRKVGRRSERLYDVVADDFAPDFGRPLAAGDSATRKAEREAITVMADGFLKTARRAIRDASLAGELEMAEPGRNFTVRFELGWLTPGEFRQLRELVTKMKQVMDRGKRRFAKSAADGPGDEVRRSSAPANAKLYLSLALAVPVARKRGARREAGL